MSETGGKRTLRPNALGLFDVLGNASEWCHASPDGDSDHRYLQRWARDIIQQNKSCIQRGGCYNYSAKLIQSFMRYHQAETGFSFTGFRIARTIAADP